MLTVPRSRAIRCWVYAPPPPPPQRDIPKRCLWHSARAHTARKDAPHTERRTRSHERVCCADCVLGEC